MQIIFHCTPYKTNQYYLLRPPLRSKHSSGLICFENPCVPQCGNSRKGKGSSQGAIVKCRNCCAEGRELMSSVKQQLLISKHTSFEAAARSLRLLSYSHVCLCDDASKQAGLCGSRGYTSTIHNRERSLCIKRRVHAGKILLLLFAPVYKGRNTRQPEHQKEIPKQRKLWDDN